MTGRAPGAFRRAEIDTAALRHNVGVMRERAGGAELMVVVKADGYGHGAVPAAAAAIDAGAAMLGTADVREALALRRAGIDAPVLSWLHGPDEDFIEAVSQGVAVAASSERQVRAVAAAARTANRRADLHLKLDTGLSRNGAPEGDWPALMDATADAVAGGDVRLDGLLSHLANTSEQSDLEASAAFDRAVTLAAARGLEPRWLHLAASAAVLSRPFAHRTLVRVGIASYGVSPFGDPDGAGLGLRPVMTVTAPVAAVRRIPRGAGVSYDHTWVADRATTLALVPLGYADGVPRAASGRGEVLLRGRRRPVRGRIAMDQFLVDVGDDEVEVGDEVVLFGSRPGAPTAEEWAGWSDSIGYEIVTRIGPRVDRVVLEG